MIKKIALTGLLFISAINLSACTPGNNAQGSTAVGAVTGGLIANQLFSGQNAFAGVIAGALIGGIIGNQVGQYMDRQDRINMQSAIIHTPINQQANWTSNRPGPQGQRITYSVTPTKSYYRDNRRRYCREYRTVVHIGGRRQTAFGRACRMPDGQWKIIK